ncbi:MAG: DUF2892 domain-containing protein [Bacteroidia bacterium]
MALHDNSTLSLLEKVIPAVVTGGTILYGLLLPIKLFRNVGTVDRIIRLVVGAGLIGAAVLTKMWWLAIPGGLLFLTGIVGRCGLYYLFGINTCPAESSSSKDDSKKKKKE